MNIPNIPINLMVVGVEYLPGGFIEMWKVFEVIPTTLHKMDNDTFEIYRQKYGSRETHGVPWTLKLIPCYRDMIPPTTKQKDS